MHIFSAPNSSFAHQTASAFIPVNLHIIPQRCINVKQKSSFQCSNYVSSAGMLREVAAPEKHKEAGKMRGRQRTDTEITREVVLQLEIKRQRKAKKPSSLQMKVSFVVLLPMSRLNRYILKLKNKKKTVRNFKM